MASVWLASAAATFAQRHGYFQGLGRLPESEGSSAQAISDDASVVAGTCIVDPLTNRTEAFRWTTVDGMTGLGDLPGGIFQSHGFGISADGAVIVGGSVSAESWVYANLEAFRCIWSFGGATMHGLGDFTGGEFGSVALNASADGSVVVGLGTTGTGPEAFRWKDLNANGWADPDERLEYHPEFALGDLPGGGYYSDASGVSADGSVIVGQSMSAASGETDYEAYRWVDLNGNGEVDPEEKLDNNPEFALGDLPGGQFHSFAAAVSADGSVVVGGSLTASGWRAYRWEDLNGNGLVDPDEKLDNHPEFALGTLPGYDHSTAHGVSADGSVVVGYCMTGTASEAFVWDADNGMRSVKEVLENDFGLDLTGWELDYSRAVSADGLVIAGEGLNPEGWLEGWLAAFRPWPLPLPSIDPIAPDTVLPLPPPGP